MPIRLLAKYDSILSYETLQTNRHLEEWSADKTTIFFSHTWLGREHPDPQGVKFRLLVDVLRMVVAGKFRPQPDYTVAFAGMARGLAGWGAALKAGYVWIDYCCVPQCRMRASINRRKEVRSFRSREGESPFLAHPSPECSQMIENIPLYVSRCSCFFVLAGAWRHAEDGSVRDLRAWMRRGWCRMELLANALSPSPKPLITIESKTAITLWQPGGVVGHGWTQSPVGEADFTSEDDRRTLGSHLVENGALPPWSTRSTWRRRASAQSRVQV